MMRQTDGHGDRRSGVLPLVLPIKNDDRIGEVAHPDVIDLDPADIRRLLDVGELLSLGLSPPLFDVHPASSEYSAHELSVSHTRTLTIRKLVRAANCALALEADPVRRSRK